MCVCVFWVGCGLSWPTQQQINMIIKFDHFLESWDANQNICYVVTQQTAAQTSREVWVKKPQGKRERERGDGMMAAAVVVWITAYVTNNLLLCLTSRGTHYLHGWKAHGERGRANNAHLGAPWCFVMFEQYTAPAPLLWGMKEINSKRGDVYKDISKQAGDSPPLL